MAAINDEKTQKFFEKKLNYEAWIGAIAKKVKTEYKNADFKWIDGSRWNYTNFIPDETTITEEGTRLPASWSSSIGPVSTPGVGYVKLNVKTRFGQVGD